jgi:hypothetical protein
MLNSILANPVVGGVLKSAPVRFAGGILSKAASLPVALGYEELFQHNPWGDKNSPLYGKGPGSLEYAAAIESANSSGRNTPIEEDYLSTPQITEASMIPSTTRMAGETDINATQKGLEQYGFNEDFKLDTSNVNADGSIPIIRSEVGEAKDARQAWLDKTANSPAARAGFSDDQRWALHTKDRDFQQARKTGTLDEFAQKYPNSNTARELAIRNRIPSVMDMEY